MITPPPPYLAFLGGDHMCSRNPSPVIRNSKHTYDKLYDTALFVVNYRTNSNRALCTDCAASTVLWELLLITWQDMVKPGNSERAGHFFGELFSSTDLLLKEYMNVAGIQVGSSATSSNSKTIHHHHHYRKRRHPS